MLTLSIQAVVEAIDNSPSKKEPPLDPLPVTKPMPQLTPAPRAFFDRAVSERQSKESAELANNDESPTGNEKSSKPKVVKRERFWEYEEIDEKPKEKNKRKLV